MAETKKAKSFDIVSGNLKADPTTRLIIINRGPIISDPAIITQANVEEDMPNKEEGMISPAKTIKINPIDADQLRSDQSSEVQTTPSQIEPPATEQTSEEPAKSEDSPNQPESKDEPQIETVVAKPEEQETKEAPKENETESPEEEPVADTQSSASREKQELAKEEAEKERLTNLDQLVESERYFLPINMREKRQNRRVILIGILICIILAVVWVDVALDAGIISNSLNLPHTNFFVLKS